MTCFIILVVVEEALLNFFMKIRLGLNITFFIVLKFDEKWNKLREGDKIRFKLTKIK